MNKQDFVEVVSEKTGTTKTLTREVVNALIESVEEQLMAGEDVSLTPLGKFTVVGRSARSGRNPQTGQPLEIPAKNVAKFKPSARLKEAVNF